MKTLVPRSSYLEEIRKLLADSKVMESLLEEQKTRIDNAIVRPLGLWRLLHGVPFNYLIPDERMLPPESIRFFHLDPDWIDCFMQGACSLGRSISRKSDSLGYVVERLLIEEADRLSAAFAQVFRADCLGLSQDGARQTASNHVTGFILRSQVVEGWKNLGVNAYPRDGTPLDEKTEHLTLLRFERLSPSLLIGLFGGTIYQLDIHEAPQGLHFGVDAGNVKSLKYDRAEGVHRLGNPVAGASCPVPFRDTTRRVIDIHQLSKDLRQALKNSDGAGPLSSTDFALQMIQGVGMVTFYLKGKAS
jgi:hypothetical protein